MRCRCRWTRSPISPASSSRIRASTSWSRSRAPGPAEPSFSRIVLQNIEVLAVAQEIQHVKDEPEVVKVVTLLVTPTDAEKLTLASHEGMLRLAMRNYSDAKIVATRGIAMAS